MRRRGSTPLRRSPAYGDERVCQSAGSRDRIRLFTHARAGALGHRRERQRRPMLTIASTIHATFAGRSPPTDRARREPASRRSGTGAVSGARFSRKGQVRFARSRLTDRHTHAYASPASGERCRASTSPQIQEPFKVRAGFGFDGVVSVEACKHAAPGGSRSPRAERAPRRSSGPDSWSPPQRAWCREFRIAGDAGAGRRRVILSQLVRCGTDSRRGPDYWFRSGVRVRWATGCGAAGCSVTAGEGLAAGWRQCRLVPITHRRPHDEGPKLSLCCVV